MHPMLRHSPRSPFSIITHIFSASNACECAVQFSAHNTAAVRILSPVARTQHIQFSVASTNTLVGRCSVDGARILIVFTQGMAARRCARQYCMSRSICIYPHAIRGAVRCAGAYGNSHIQSASLLYDRYLPYIHVRRDADKPRQIISVSVCMCVCVFVCSPSTVITQRERSVDLLCMCYVNIKVDRSAQNAGSSRTAEYSWVGEAASAENTKKGLVAIGIAGINDDH